MINPLSIQAQSRLLYRSIDHNNFLMFFNIVYSLFGDIMDISCNVSWQFLYHKFSENFLGIIPEMYRYFSANFRKKSAGNFRTHNPDYQI